MRFDINLALVIGVLAFGTVYAAEEGGGSAAGLPTTWGNFYIPPERMAYFREVIETVREKYPSEFNEVMALRQTNPAEAIRRGSELARRAGFDVPGGLAPSGTAQSEAGPEQSFAAVGKTGTVSRNFRRKKMRAVNLALQERFPEEYARLEEMRIRDPEEARYCFRELVSRLDDLQEIYASLEPEPEAREAGRPGNGRRHRFGPPPEGAPEMPRGETAGFPSGNGAFAPGGDGGNEAGAGNSAPAAASEKNASGEESSLPWWME